MVIIEFLNSSFWSDIRGRVLATFGFAGAGTAADALPKLTVEQTAAFIELEYAIRVLTLFSYAMSILVGITVLWRFFVWLKEDKINKNKKQD
jgi:hypothetical protein